MITIFCKRCGKPKKVPNYAKGNRMFCSSLCANTFNIKENPEHIAKRQKIIKEFKNLRSYIEVGKLFNLSRQRIEQIIRRYAPDLVKVKSPFVRYFSKHYGLPCKGCGKKLNIEVKHDSYGYCRSCDYFATHPNARRRYKQDSEKCDGCDRKFGRKVPYSSLGLCKRCYDNYRYHTNPIVRQKTHAATLAYLKRKRATDPVWHAKHLKYHREYDRKRRELDKQMKV